jgi:adenylate kinase
MIILMLGPQGSGKGTQARLLAEEFGFFDFESGGFLRELAFKNEKLRELLAAGNLVPDEEMSSYVASFLESKGIYDNIIFDGFPRTLNQYRFFKNWLEDKKIALDLVIVLTIREKETIRRLSARRQDPETGKIYNLITNPPPATVDHAKLVQREDDMPQAIKKRLAWYQSEVVPLVRHLQKETKVLEIDGERPIAEIKADLVAQIRSLQSLA